MAAENSTGGSNPLTSPTIPTPSNCFPRLPKVTFPNRANTRFCGKE